MNRKIDPENDSSPEGGFTEEKPMLKRVIPAKIDQLDEVLEFVDQILDKAAFSKKVKLQIHLAVEEIFVNIASYAYPSGEGEAEVCCEMLSDPERIRVRLADSGIMFDPLAKEDADTSKEALLAREGGLGILLVKKLADKVEYIRKDGKNVLTFEKLKS